MCRHLAYLGAPVTLRSVIIDPPHGLYTQAWAPRFQRPGAVNADGFGAGWYPGDADVAGRTLATRLAMRAALAILAALASLSRPGTGRRCLSGRMSPLPTWPG